MAGYLTLMLVLGLPMLVVLVLYWRSPAQPSQAQWELPTDEKFAAIKRAERLLKEMLTEAERQQLERDRYLEVPSPNTPGRVYRVPRYMGRIHVCESGTPVMSLCVEPVEPLPSGDIVLAHKLMIEANEQEYLRIANRFGPPFHPPL